MKNHLAQLKYTLVFLLFFIAKTDVLSQTRFDTIQAKLDTFSRTSPGLKQKVELAISDVTLSEFINAIATSSKLNISVDDGLNNQVANNFYKVPVRDVLVFLCKRYDLDISFFGSIINISRYKSPVDTTKKVVNAPRMLKISYVTPKDLLSIDVKKDSLYAIVKEITTLSGRNVIASSDIEYTLASAFIQSQPFASAIELFAYVNNYKLTITPDSTFLLDKKDVGSSIPPGSLQASATGQKKGKSGPLNIVVTNGTISFDASNMPIQEIFLEVTQQLKLDYYLFSDIKGIATLRVSNLTYEEFLGYLLNGTDYTFKKENGIYLVGDRNLEGLRMSKVLQLKFRTVDKIIDFIPADLKKGVDIKMFADLNSLILSGSNPRINELESFIHDLDRVVPVISIEVIVMEVRKASTVSKGLSAGIGDKPVTTQGTIFPALDMTFGAQSINNVISGLGGLGSLILGKVTPNFYITLKLLEENGSLRLRSTPKLATLNGHEASLSIGKTEYYLETQNNVIGSQNPQNIITQQYKPVNADLALTINPIVSGDEQITLDISVRQSNFTERISPNAPPGNTSRDFKSLIRVKNDEMILLGGLEENSVNDSGRGVPGLSRVPGLKWLFSNRDKSRSKSKLVILVKPTVLY